MVSKKKPLWRQMQEYKREASRAAEHCTGALEQRQEAWVQRIGQFCRVWDQVS